MLPSHPSFADQSTGDAAATIAAAPRTNLPPEEESTGPGVFSSRSVWTAPQHLHGGAGGGRKALPYAAVLPRPAARAQQPPCGPLGEELTTAGGVFKQPWTTEEDQSLLQLVEESGVGCWSVIADRLPGRVGKQCRERYSPLTAQPPPPFADLRPYLTLISPYLVPCPCPQHITSVPLGVCAQVA